MKILCLYGGPVCYMGNFIEAMSKYADVDGCNIFSANGDDWEPAYEIDTPKFNKVIWPLNISQIRKYDYVIGLDNGCLDITFRLNMSTGITAGCLILDYPKHTFKNNKDFNAKARESWHVKWEPTLSKNGFLIHCRNNAQSDLKYLAERVPSVFHPLPCKILNGSNNLDTMELRGTYGPEKYPKIREQNYIMYSGMISGAKGVHHIISALGMIENPPALVLVGGGDGHDVMQEFGNFLDVDVYRLYSVGEKDKFTLYHGAKAIVYGHDTGVIPGLCGLEGIGVGKNLICWDFNEHRIMYRGFADYVEPLNISKFAWFIEEEIRNPKDNSRGIEYVKDKCSFDSWAKTVYEFLETL